MQTRVDHEVLFDLLDRTGLDDRALKRLFGIHQTTLWRLRKGKIAKVRRYIDLLRQSEMITPQDSDTALVESLVAVARRSPALHALLVALRNFMQESA